MGLRKVVLITTGQPSTNPRIVKEADALQSAGFDVAVLYCHYINWATDADKNLLNNKTWKHQLIGGSPFQNKALYTLTRIRFRLARLVHQYFGNKMLLAERSQARAYDELLKAAKRIKAGWYIGHNLGALSIAVKAAEYNGGNAGFDFEDYHRGESTEATTQEINRIIYLENKYVPGLNYIIASSPLIANKIAFHFPQQKDKILTLLNCFPLSHQPAFKEKKNEDESLQLFWFSQTIGTNRGLEILVDAMIQMNDIGVHLTLAGKCDSDFKEYLDSHAGSLKNHIHFAGIISPDEIAVYAAKFDVGMALELPTPENRNICLTNKIFTYLLAGNVIVFSETKMQKQFAEEHKVGDCFSVDDVQGLIDILIKYKNKKISSPQRKYNYQLAEKVLNWENESKKLIKYFTI
ncbi:MAG: hypothetical protein EOO46_03015 [Flavobacterium sp.]|nr:MAG: hypothetical protein EOO46_03015 [Flavobacterium sp.]